MKEGQKDIIASIGQVSLKDRAVAAYREEQEHKARNETSRFAKRAEATVKDFKKRFGVFHIIAHGTCDTVLTHEGLRLRATFNDRYSNNNISAFALHGTCPDCNADCWSRAIFDLADLGKQIGEFTPAHGHQCGSTPHCPTVGETLLEALQGYIEEITYDG